MGCFSLQECVISLRGRTCRLRPRQIPGTEQMFHAESPSSPAATHIQLGKGSGAPDIPHPSGAPYFMRGSSHGGGRGSRGTAAAPAGAERGARPCAQRGAQGARRGERTADCGQPMARASRGGTKFPATNQLARGREGRKKKKKGRKKKKEKKQPGIMREPGPRHPPLPQHPSSLPPPCPLRPASPPGYVESRAPASNRRPPR